MELEESELGVGELVVAFVWSFEAQGERMTHQDHLL